jgi:hypothetical protein
VHLYIVHTNIQYTDTQGGEAQTLVEMGAGLKQNKRTDEDRWEAEGGGDQGLLCVSVVAPGVGESEEGVSGGGGAGDGKCHELKASVAALSICVRPSSAIAVANWLKAGPVCVCVYIYTHTYIHIYTYVYIYIYIYI